MQDSKEHIERAEWLLSEAETSQHGGGLERARVLAGMASAHAALALAISTRFASGETKGRG